MRSCVARSTILKAVAAALALLACSCSRDYLGYGPSDPGYGSTYRSNLLKRKAWENRNRSDNSPQSQPQDPAEPADLADRGQSTAAAPEPSPFGRSEPNRFEPRGGISPASAASGSPASFAQTPEVPDPPRPMPRPAPVPEPATASQPPRPAPAPVDPPATVAPPPRRQPFNPGEKKSQIPGTRGVDDVE